MPLKTGVDPKTGKLKTYQVSPLGLSVTDNGRLVPKHELPSGVKRLADELKQGGRPKLGARTQKIGMPKMGPRSGR